MSREQLIAAELARELSQTPAYELFISSMKIASRFGTSEGTVRHARRRLVGRKLIYKKDRRYYVA
jgi:DNA-binding GntR family transcriptional regulator